MSRLIKLSKGYEALVDSEDYEYLSKVNWHVKNNGDNNMYAVRQTQKDKKRIEISMHRLILGITDSQCHVDHINGNSLDNRKINLRACTNAENRRNSKMFKNNTIGYRGVQFKKNLKKPYQARITCNNKTYHIGYFTTAKEAAEAYDKKAKELHGDFASLNFKVGSNGQ